MPDAADSTAPESPTPKSRPPGQPQRDDINLPREKLWLLLLFGVVLQAASGVLIGVQWPATELVEGECETSYSGYMGAPEEDCEPDEVKPTGSAGLVTVGLVGAGLGSLMAMVGVVGFGVSLGMRDHAYLEAERIKQAEVKDDGPRK